MKAYILKTDKGYDIAIGKKEFFVSEIEYTPNKKADQKDKLLNAGFHVQQSKNTI